MPPLTQAGPVRAHAARGLLPLDRSPSPLQGLHGCSWAALLQGGGGGGLGAGAVGRRWTASDRPGRLLGCSLASFTHLSSRGLSLAARWCVRPRALLAVGDGKNLQPPTRAAVRRQRGRDFRPTRPRRAGRQAEGAGAAERAGPTPPKPAPRAVRTPRPAGRRARPPVRAGACRAGLRPEFGAGRPLAGLAGREIAGQWARTRGAGLPRTPAPPRTATARGCGSCPAARLRG